MRDESTTFWIIYLKIVLILLKKEKKEEKDMHPYIREDFYFLLLIA